MIRSKYFDTIESHLSWLATRIEMRGSLNILDLHLHSENFYQDFFNLLFGWNLHNLNATKHNIAGVDLADNTNKIIVQVSATATPQKIESALNKVPSNYQDYSFKFISISKNASDLRTRTFANPHGLKFSPTVDIFDVPSLLKFIVGLDLDRQEKVYEFIRKQIKYEPDSGRVESNLTTIINILSNEDWSKGASEFETVPYDPEEKISYNQLKTAKVLIDDYKIHYPRIEKIYSDFDRQGVNKSLSILNGIRSEYLNLDSADSPDQRFFSIIEKVIQKIQVSANYTPIPEEELKMSVQVLVVDAFIRCKIFKNPLGNADARS